MINMLMMMLLLTMITIILMTLNILMSKKSFKDREKSSPYECGFDPLNSTSESFSIQFFTISIMFLTFDIEITMLIPMMPLTSELTFSWLLTSATVMAMLIMGFLSEWIDSSISWEK